MVNKLIIYEDEFIVIVNKPSGLLVHHSFYARNVQGESLVEILRKQIDISLAPVHRLDKGTSGIVIFSKSSEVTKSIQTQINNRLASKTYIALVRGFTEEEGRVDSPIREPDSNLYKDACTVFRKIAQIELAISVEPFSTSRYSLIELHPVTGRMHQLRKHMNKIAHPIIGDKKYGNRHHNNMFINNLYLGGMFLHAYQMEFTHPIEKKQMLIKAEFPARWKDMAEKTGLADKLPDTKF